MAYSNIPYELKILAQWVCWRYEPLDNGNVTKIPYHARTGEKASSTSASTWSSFEQCVAAVHNYSGIGFVLTHNDPYCVIDLDCPTSGEQLERHKAVLQYFNTYCELSPSGKGAHLVAKAFTPKGVKRDNIEVYTNQRYITFTGQLLNNLPITDCQKKVDELFHQMQPQVFSDFKDQDQKYTDLEIYNMAADASNKDKFLSLWNGYWNTEYPTQSEADYALVSILCFYSKNNAQVMRLFRMSALGQRPKAQRDHYLIGNYGAITNIRSKEPPLIDFSALDEKVKLLNSSKAVFTEKTKSSITNPGGLVGLIAEYIYSTAIKPMPEVALLTALGVIAGIGGRSFNISHTGINLYLLLVANTGTGKDEIGKSINRLFLGIKDRVLNAADFFGVGSISSGQAVIQKLNDTPCFFSIINEFSHFYSTLTALHAPSYTVKFKEMLLQLYTMSGEQDVLRESIYSDKQKNTKNISSPAVTLLCESTPGDLYAKMDASHIKSGLLPRFSILEYTGKRQPTNRETAFDLPDVFLADHFANLVEHVVALQHNNQRIHIKMTDAAKKLLYGFDDYCDAMMNADDADELTMDLWNRGYIKALKTAGVVAVGYNWYDPKVTSSNAQWAIDFVKRDVALLKAKFSEGSVGQGSGPQEHALKNTIKKYLGMSARKKRSLNVTANVASSSVIPFLYLKNALRSHPSFVNDRLGVSTALSRATDNLIKSGELVKVDAQTARNTYKTQGVLYTIAGDW